MNKLIIASILFTILAIGGIVFLLRDNRTGNTPDRPMDVSVVDGKQVIEIHAKGGYAPRTTVARANTPTVINIRTDGTFDCSSALSIPALDFRANLPPSGITPINIPPQASGTVLKGVCTMGMYSFKVSFR